MLLFVLCSVGCVSGSFSEDLGLEPKDAWGVCFMKEEERDNLNRDVEDDNGPE